MEHLTTLLSFADNRSILTGIIVAIYTGLIGTIWGLLLRRILAGSVGSIGIICLGTLIFFEWFVRIPLARFAYPMSVYHLTTSAWVQVWIATFAGGAMSGFSFCRSRLGVRIRRIHRGG